MSKCSGPNDTKKKVIFEMENEKYTVLNITNENGKEEEIKVVLYFNFEDDDKNYVIYSYNNDSQEYFASEIEETENEIILKKIEDQQAIDDINEMMKELANEEN